MQLILLVIFLNRWFAQEVRSSLLLKQTIATSPTEKHPRRSLSKRITRKNDLTISGSWSFFWFTQICLCLWCVFVLRMASMSLPHCDPSISWGLALLFGSKKHQSQFLPTKPLLGLWRIFVLMKLCIHCHLDAFSEDPNSSFDAIFLHVPSVSTGLRLLRDSASWARGRLMQIVQISRWV